MLDSLDLEDLRRQVEENKQFRRSVLKEELTVVGIFLILFFFLGLCILLQSRTFIQTAIAYIIGWFPIFSALLIVLFGHYAYKTATKNSQNVNLYFPSFLERRIARPSWKVWLYLAMFLPIIVFAPSLILLWGIAVFIPPLTLELAKLWASHDINEGTLKRTNFMLHWFPTNWLFLNLRAVLLLSKGNLAEAEQTFRTLLFNTQITYSSTTYSLLLNNLSCALIYDKRYDEAIPLLEAAVQISPAYSTGYDSLAILYLERGIYPERALELARAAIEYRNKWSANAAFLWKATCARASALTGYNLEANALLDEAFTKIKSFPPPAQAEVYRHAGYTRRAQGDETAARELFTKAVQLDPDGLYGKLAQKALDSTPSN